MAYYVHVGKSEGDEHPHAEIFNESRIGAIEDLAFYDEDEYLFTLYSEDGKTSHVLNLWDEYQEWLEKQEEEQKLWEAHKQSYSQPSIYFGA